MTKSIKEIRDYPHGRGWECLRCHLKFPEDIEDDDCPHCGFPLTRVALELRYDK